MERASAVMILNDRVTGRTKAVVVDSIISKHRTAASIALASKVLAAGEQGGHTDFLHSSLADILPGNANLPERDNRKIIFYAFQFGFGRPGRCRPRTKHAHQRWGGTLIKSFLL